MPFRWYEVGPDHLTGPRASHAKLTWIAGREKALSAPAFAGGPVFNQRTSVGLLCIGPSCPDPRGAGRAVGLPELFVVGLPELLVPAVLSRTRPGPVPWSVSCPGWRRVMRAFPSLVGPIVVAGSAGSLVDGR